MADVLVMILMTIGALFMLVAGLGILRLPDLYMRMSAATKATSLGVGCLMTAAAIHFGELAVTSRAAAVVLFVLSTAPVAAHMIGRAAYFTGVPLWQRSVVDELREHRDAETSPPASPPEPPDPG